MMEKYRPAILVLVSLVLGALTWLDNRNSQLPDKGTVTVSAESTAPAPRETKQLSDNAAPAPDSAAAVPILSGNPLASFDKASLENWVARPLFAPSRTRPPPQAVAKAAVKAAPPPEYHLLGVVLNADRAIALLRSETTGVDVRVQVGDMIGGWHVAAVEREIVTLKRDEDTSQTVRFKNDCANAIGTACP